MAVISKIASIFKKKPKDEYWFVPGDANNSPKRTKRNNIVKCAKNNKAEMQKIENNVQASTKNDVVTQKTSSDNSADVKTKNAPTIKAQATKKERDLPLSPASNEAIQTTVIEAYYDEDAADEVAKQETVEDAPLKGFNGMFEIKKSKDERYVFNLYASNHVIIATSQIYASSKNAINGIKSVIVNAERAGIEDQTTKNFPVISFPKWEIYIDKAKQYRFRLRATNGSCICHSQGYKTKASCKKGIDSIIKTAKKAKIDKAYLTQQ